jgi:hypothetical protein
LRLLRAAVAVAALKAVAVMVAVAVAVKMAAQAARGATQALQGPLPTPMAPMERNPHSMRRAVAVAVAAY